MSSKTERPKVTRGPTLRRKTGCGDLSVSINSNNGTEHPIEVIAHLGKAGSCASCQLEALGRCISLGLQYGIHLDEFVDQLKGIECPSKNLFPEDQKNLSCADAVAKALEQYKHEYYNAGR